MAGGVDSHPAQPGWYVAHFRGDGDHGPEVVELFKLGPQFSRAGAYAVKRAGYFGFYDPINFRWRDRVEVPAS